ncbi:uncharacterized protein LOC129310989 [Prosopis cineraria]|uniref:uncharacterized protein LOC129310989 n=1 Tax=Prosopis cineraria TaxID=364024 RepID=UPI00240FD3FE|nr:uncharacterized protein LOC129310989 [Prosopis cineraria]
MLTIAGHCKLIRSPFVSINSCGFFNFGLWQSFFAAEGVMLSWCGCGGRIKLFPPLFHRRLSLSISFVHLRMCSRKQELFISLCSLFILPCFSLQTSSFLSRSCCCRFFFLLPPYSFA